MAEHFQILGVQFELPEPFSHETEKFRFEETPFDPGRRLEVLSGDAQMGVKLGTRFRNWLERSYEGVKLVKDRERGRRRLIRATATAPSGRQVHAALATVSDQIDLRLRFLSVGDGIGDEWQRILESIEEKEDDRHGWVEGSPTRYQVNGLSLEVPDGWQDTTDYLFRAGSSSDSKLDLRAKWEEEPGRTPQSRVQSLLRKIQAGDPSVRTLEDRSIKVDGHTSHYASWENMEVGSKLRSDIFALSTDSESGIILLISGPEGVFYEHKDKWIFIRDNISVI